MNKLLINQPAGIGDILFCYKLAVNFCDSGFKVVWPVIPLYLSDLQTYIEPHPNIKFTSIDSEFPLKSFFTQNEATLVKTDEGDVYLPLTFADRYYSPGESFLKAKYKLCDAQFPYNSWSDAIKLKRDSEKESRLFYEVLGLQEDDEFVLVNKKFGTAPDVRKKSFAVEESCKVVELRIVENFSLFDWCLVIERAQKIYSVDTSLFFLIELLDLKDTPLFAYSRHSHFIHVDDLFTSNWIYKYE